ncbi:hypothetical protein JCM10213_002446 [Rhodosporidiobolus nylandii]
MGGPRGQGGERGKLQARGGEEDFGPGDYGWGTDLTTRTVYVDATSYSSSTTVYTVYEGVDTTLTLTPNVATFTLFPTATRYETSVIVKQQTTTETRTSVYTATIDASTVTTIALPAETVTVEPEPTTATVSSSTAETSSSSGTLPTTPPPWLTLSSAPSTRTTRTSTEASHPTQAVPARSSCLPRDEREREPGLFSPTHEQAATLYVMAIYVVGVTVAWNLWGLRVLLYGFKSFTVFLHESGHVLGITLSGQPLYRFTIDPNAGGASHTTPGRRLTPLGLFLGQVFSIVFGGLLIFTGFNTLASKYASFIIMVLWLPVIAFQANILSMLVCAASLALLVGIWRARLRLARSGRLLTSFPRRFIEHATALRYYVLFLGVLSSFYIVWDTMDDFFHRKRNECCVVMLESNTAVAAMVWFATWLLLSLLVVTGFILGGLAYWRQTEHAMYCQGQSFAPT